MPSIEITTVVGCKNACTYCPQDKLLEAYARRSNVFQMSFGAYKTCLDKIPLNVPVHFTGISEPWLNPECSKMAMYSYKKGHRVDVSTTLVGMSISEVDLIKTIPLTIVRIEEDFGNEEVEMKWQKKEIP